MKLQISSQLAVFALLELAAHPERQYSVAEMGEKYRVSNHHLAKVMHSLGRAGLVRSVRGVGGGYQFSGSVRRTTLLDIIEVFEALGSGDADQGLGRSTDAGRALREVLTEIDEGARATLGSITIGTMLKLVDRQRKGVPSTRRARAAW